MNNNSNQKLISSSKRMLVILRGLLVLVILMAVIPWLFPTSALAEFLLGSQGFPVVIIRNHKNIHEFMLTLTPLSHLFGFIGSLIAVMPLLIGTMIMIRLFKMYAVGRVFSLDNAKLYSWLGVLSVISALFLQPIYQMFFYACVTINNPVGHRMVGFTLGIDTLTALFFAIVLVVIGKVMQVAHKMREEQDLTV